MLIYAEMLDYDEYNWFPVGFITEDVNPEHAVAKINESIKAYGAKHSEFIKQNRRYSFDGRLPMQSAIQELSDYLEELTDDAKSFWMHHRDDEERALVHCQKAGMSGDLLHSALMEEVGLESYQISYKAMVALSTGSWDIQWCEVDDISSIVD
jgi:hypothetical protein